MTSVNPSSTSFIGNFSELCKENQPNHGWNQQHIDKLAKEKKYDEIAKIFNLKFRELKVELPPAIQAYITQLLYLPSWEGYNLLKLSLENGFKDHSSMPILGDSLSLGGLLFTFIDAVTAFTACQRLANQKATIESALSWLAQTWAERRGSPDFVIEICKYTQMMRTALETPRALETVSIAITDGFPLLLNSVMHSLTIGFRVGLLDSATQFPEFTGKAKDFRIYMEGLEESKKQAAQDHLNLLERQENLALAGDAFGLLTSLANMLRGYTEFYRLRCTRANLKLIQDRVNTAIKKIGRGVGTHILDKISKSYKNKLYINAIQIGGSCVRGLGGLTSMALKIVTLCAASVGPGSVIVGLTTLAYYTIRGVLVNVFERRSGRAINQVKNTGHIASNTENGNPQDAILPDVAADFELLSQDLEKVKNLFSYGLKRKDVFDTIQSAWDSMSKGERTMKILTGIFHALTPSMTESIKEGKKSPDRRVRFQAFAQEKELQETPEQIMIREFVKHGKGLNAAHITEVLNTPEPTPGQSALMKAMQELAKNQEFLRKRVWYKRLFYKPKELTSKAHDLLTAFLNNDPTSLNWKTLKTVQRLAGTDLSIELQFGDVEKDNPVHAENIITKAKFKELAATLVKHLKHPSKSAQSYEIRKNFLTALAGRDLALLSPATILELCSNGKIDLAAYCLFKTDATRIEAFKKQWHHAEENRWIFRAGILASAIKNLNAYSLIGTVPDNDTALELALMLNQLAPLEGVKEIRRALSENLPQEKLKACENALRSLHGKPQKGDKNSWAQTFVRQIPEKVFASLNGKYPGYNVKSRDESVLSREAEAFLKDRYAKSPHLEKILQLAKVLAKDNKLVSQRSIFWYFFKKKTWSLTPQAEQLFQALENGKTDQISGSTLAMCLSRTSLTFNNVPVSFKCVDPVDTIVALRFQAGSAEAQELSALLEGEQDFARVQRFAKEIDNANGDFLKQVTVELRNCKGDEATRQACIKSLETALVLCKQPPHIAAEVSRLIGKEGGSNGQWRDDLKAALDLLTGRTLHGHIGNAALREIVIAGLTASNQETIGDNEWIVCTKVGEHDKRWELLVRDIASKKLPVEKLPEQLLDKELRTLLKSHTGKAHSQAWLEQIELGLHAHKNDKPQPLSTLWPRSVLKSIIERVKNTLSGRLGENFAQSEESQVLDAAEIDSSWHKKLPTLKQIYRVFKQANPIASALAIRHILRNEHWHPSASQIDTLRSAKNKRDFQTSLISMVVEHRNRFLMDEPTRADGNRHRPRDPVAEERGPQSHREIDDEDISMNARHAEHTDSVAHELQAPNSGASLALSKHVAHMRKSIPLHPGHVDNIPDLDISFA